MFRVKMPGLQVEKKSITGGLQRSKKMKSSRDYKVLNISLITSTLISYFFIIDFNRELPRPAF